MALSYLTIADISFSFLALFVLVKFLWCSSPPPASLPPGPKGLPLVGNILDMPSSKEWLTFAQWGERWGKSIITNLGLALTDVSSVSLKVTYVLSLSWARLLSFSTLRKSPSRCSRKRIQFTLTVQYYRWEGSSLVGRIHLCCYPTATASDVPVVSFIKQLATHQ
jgi:hypothetical protein